MMRSPLYAVDLFIEATYKNDVAGVEYALSLLGSVDAEPKVLRVIVQSHTVLMHEAERQLAYVDAQLITATTKYAHDILVIRHDSLVFERNMWKTLVDHVATLL